jgi:hypothetical protein
MSEILPILMKLQEDIGAIKEATSVLPDMTKRVVTLEKQHSRLKGYGTGFVAAFTALEAYLKLHK